MKTEIIAIIDKSQSMDKIRDATISGFNEFLQDQKSAPGEARITTVLFDSQVHPTLHYKQDVQSAVPLSREIFDPHGMTALHDAMGTTLRNAANRIAQEKWADLVIVLVATDGEENSSKSYTSQHVKTLVEHLQKAGWKFLFAAANIDAFATGRNLGINAAGTMSYDATEDGSLGMYRSMSASTFSMRSDPSAPLNLSAVPLKPVNAESNANTPDQT